MKKQALQEYHSRVNKAIDHLRQHLDNDVSLEELSKRTHLSKFHFLRIFHSITGISPGEYHNWLRLQRAQFRLISHPKGQISVTKIAYELGFSSVSSLCKSFKKSKDTSPSEWQANYLRKHSNIGHSQHHNYRYLRTIFNQRYTDMEQQNQFNCQVKELKDQSVFYLRNFSIHVHDSQSFQIMFKNYLIGHTLETFSIFRLLKR